MCWTDKKKPKPGIYFFVLTFYFILLNFLFMSYYITMKKKTGLVPYYMGQPTDYSMEEHQV